MNLTLNNISHSFGAYQALKNISLSVKEGEVLALLGPSGCGKSTLLRLIAGLEALQAGDIHLGGTVLASPKDNPPPEARPVGLVFQEHALFPGMTVAKNIEFGLTNLSIEDRVRRRDELLAMIGMPDLADRLPGTLSGGQQQRVALARALAPSPKIMLLDEPYASVDVLLRRQLQESARVILKRTQSAAILVTHDPEEALEMSDQIAVMGQGTVLQAGTPQTIVNNPNCAEVARLFGEAQTISGSIEDGAFICDLGRIGLPEQARQEHPNAKMLVARPSGLDFEPVENGEFQVLDIRHRTSGKVVLIGNLQGSPTDYVRVDCADDASLNIGQRGRLTARDNNTFLF